MRRTHTNYAAWSSSGAPLKLIGILGQSTAVGRGNVNTDVGVATPPWTAPFTGVTLKQYEGTHVDPPVTVYDDTRALQPRTWNDPAVNQGTELSMGRYLYGVKPGAFAIVKWGIGATGLQEGFTPSSTYPSTGGNALARAIAYFQQAAGQLGGQFVLFCFYGCETDALTTGPANAVNVNMAAMLGGLRTAFGANIPLVFEELTSQLPIGTYPFRDTVRAQQTTFVGGATNVTMINCDDLPIDSGNHEYVGDSLLTFGNRAAIAALALLNIDIPPVAAFNFSANALVVTFTDASTDVDGSIVGWRWTFGDGSNSVAQNPVHGYGANGNYTVTLTAVDNKGGTNTVTRQVNVSTPTWTLDATSRFGTPATPAEWTQFGATLPVPMGPPAFRYEMQDASGNLAEANGTGKTLTVGGAPVYQVTIPGWSRKGIGPNGTATNQTAANNAMPNINAHSTLAYALVLVTTTAAQPSRFFYGAGSVNDFQAQAGTDKTRLRDGAAANGTVAMSGAVFPVWLKLDRTGQINALYTNKEKITVAWNPAAAGASLTVQFGTSLDAASSTTILQLAVWNDADAEQSDANISAFGSGLGWTMSGF